MSRASPLAVVPPPSPSSPEPIGQPGPIQSALTGNPEVAGLEDSMLALENAIDSLAAALAPWVALADQVERLAQAVTVANATIRRAARR